MSVFGAIKNIAPNIAPRNKPLKYIHIFTSTAQRRNKVLKLLAMAEKGFFWVGHKKNYFLYVYKSFAIYCAVAP